MASDISRDGAPVLVELGGEGMSLERVSLISGLLGQFDEALLQNLIHATPACLPISEIKPGLGRLMLACREFPTLHCDGYTDGAVQ